MTHISFSSLLRKNNMGEKTDWVGKKLTSQIFPRGKKLTGEKTDRYTVPVQIMEHPNLIAYRGSYIISARFIEFIKQVE